MKTIEATKFVRGQSDKVILNLLPDIVKSATKALRANKGKRGLYPFSRIVSLRGKPWNSLPCRLVEITSKNSKFLESAYVKRRRGEIPYLKRWFPLDAPVRRVKAHHIDIILYSKAQLAKEGTKIKSDWGIVCINVEMRKASPPAPSTMINNQMGVAFGGNGSLLNKRHYKKSVDFWSRYALLENKK
jgi:hypothetical protein